MSFKSSPDYPKIRMTARRKLILEELKKSCEHLTADEVFERVRKKVPQISLGTVYRNLEALSDTGMILVIEGGNQRRFDARHEFHYHMRCVRCGRLDDAPVETDPTLESQVRGFSDYQILGHKLEFFGYCPSCKQLKEEKNG